MKKIKMYLCCALCVLMLFGCSKKDDSKRVVGSNEEIAISLINDIIENNYDDFNQKYCFTGNVAETVRTGRFESVLKPYFDNFGDFEGQEKDYVEETGQFTYIYFPMHFKNEDINIIVTMNQNQEVVDIDFDSYNESN